MVPLPAMGTHISWFMLILLQQLSWQNLPFFEQLWLTVGKTWWICFCSLSGFLCVFHLLHTFYISALSDVAVTWQKPMCLQPALYPGRLCQQTAMKCQRGAQRSQVHLFRLRCANLGRNGERNGSLQRHTEEADVLTHDNGHGWLFQEFNRRKSGRKKQIKEGSAFSVWIAEACQSLLCLWLQSSCCLFWWWWEIAVKYIILLHCQNFTLPFLTDSVYLSLNWPPYGRQCCGGKQAPLDGDSCLLCSGDNPVKVPAALHCLWTWPWLTKSLLDIQCSDLSVGLDLNSFLNFPSALRAFSGNAILLHSNLRGNICLPPLSFS